MDEDLGTYGDGLLLVECGEVPFIWVVSLSLIKGWKVVFFLVLFFLFLLQSKID